MHGGIGNATVEAGVGAMTAAVGQQGAWRLWRYCCHPRGGDRLGRRTGGGGH